MSPKERAEMILQISWAKAASEDYFKEGMKSQGDPLNAKRMFALQAACLKAAERMQQILDQDNEAFLKPSSADLPAWAAPLSSALPVPLLAQVINQCRA